MTYCEWFYRIGPEDTEGWEPEIHDLAAVSRSGASIPPGFVVSYNVYEQLFEAGPLRAELTKASKGLVPSHPERYAEAAKTIRSQILKAVFPAEAAKGLRAFYEQLHTQLIKGKGHSLRLSYIALSGDEALVTQNVKSFDEFEKALKQVYSLMFSEHDIYQRTSSGHQVVPSSFSVIVQASEAPAASGLAACHDSDNHDDLTIQIDAWPMARPQSAPIATHDSFRVDRKSLALLSRNLKRQWWAEDGSGKFVSPRHQPDIQSSLDDEQVISLARIIRQAQTPFQQVMRFEWVYAHKQFMISRAFRMEQRGECCHKPASAVNENAVHPLLEGLSGSLGIISGPVRIITHKKDRLKLKEGEIAVVDHLVGQDDQWLSLAAGLVAESGTKTGTETRLAKRLVMPAVVGASKATSLLTDGQMVTVDGTRGLVYKGIHTTSSFAYSPNQPVTGTKIWSVISDPYQVSGQDLAASDGVGLLRGEFIIRMLGLHPHDILRRGFAKDYTEIMAEGINRVTRLISPHPLIYQLHDLDSADLLGLRKRHEERHEPNPTLGYRGTHRLLNEPELLGLEIQAVLRVAERGMDNISLMLPMVRSIQEVKQMLKHVDNSALTKHLPTRLWVKCETPGMLILMEDLCKLDIAGVCFDVPALTQLIQGIDKDNAQVSHHLDTTDQAVEQALFYAIRTCRAAGIPTMLIAEMDELRPEVVQSAVRAGVTGVSVIPSFIPDMRALLASVEQRMVLDHLLDAQE